MLLLLWHLIFKCDVKYYDVTQITPNNRKTIVIPVSDLQPSEYSKN